MSAQLKTKTSTAYTGEAARRIITLRRAAQKMLMELESSHLEVVLIPGRDWSEDHPDRNKIRGIQERNAKWYRDFCEGYTARRRARCKYHPRKCTCPIEEKRKRRWTFRNRRKHDTLIKRQWTIRGLEELIRGRCETDYAHRLADFIEQQARRAA